MSRLQTLGALVNERLAAAAEDISARFESTTAELEEELCASREENQRKQRLLDQALSSTVLLFTVGPSPGLNQGLNQNLSGTSWIKEEPGEQSVTEEEEQLSVPVPEFIAVRVKSEEPSLLQQSPTEPREETQGEGVISEPHFLSETEGHTELSPDTDSDDEPPFSSSTAHMETEADGDQYNQVQTRDRSSKLSSQNQCAPENTVHNVDMSGAAGGAERRRHQCSVCNKRCGFKSVLQRHMRVHTGEKPYSCSTCHRDFAQQSNLVRHIRTHTGDKPYSCEVCQKSFAASSSLVQHRRTHTGDKPYRCAVCQKSFAESSNLKRHRRTHTGERAYSCMICDKAFNQKQHLNIHRRTHTGEKPFVCPICTGAFTRKSSLNSHLRSRHGQV